MSSLVSSHLGTEKKFTIPKIFNTKKPESTTETKFSSLADLTKSHLKNNNVNKASIFGNKINLENKISTPVISKDLSKLSLKEKPVAKQESEWCIDLTNVLKTTPSSTSRTRINDNKEDFIPQFISCEKTHTASRNMFYCTFDIKKQALMFNNLYSKVSPFGKVITRVYRSRRPLRDITTPYSNLKRFTFDTKSPDDLVLAHLRRK